MAVSVSSVSAAGMILNITAVILGGGDFVDDVGLEAAVAGVLNNLFNNNLKLNILVAGSTAPFA